MEAAATAENDYVRLVRAVKGEIALPNAHPYAAALKHSGGVGILSLRGKVAFFGRRVVLPLALWQAALATLHADHAAYSTMVQKAKRSLWWPGMDADLQATVARCEFCCTNKESRPPEPLQEKESTRAPFDRLDVDLFQDAKGVKWLVACDEFSGDIRLSELPTNPTAQAVINSFAQLFSATALPRVIRCDGERILTARSTRDFLADLGVKLSVSSPGFPQSNGRAEASVKAARSIVDGAKATLTGNAARAAIVRGLVSHRNAPRYGVSTPGEVIYGAWLNDGLPGADMLPRRTPSSPSGARARKATMDRRRYRTARRAPSPLIGDHVVAQDHLGEPYRRRGVVVAREERDVFIQEPGGGQPLRRNRRMVRPARPRSRSSSAANDGPPLPRRSMRPRGPAAGHQEGGAARQ